MSDRKQGVLSTTQSMICAGEYGNAKRQLDDLSQSSAVFLQEADENLRNLTKAHKKVIEKLERFAVEKQKIQEDIDKLNGKIKELEAKSDRAVAQLASNANKFEAAERDRANAQQRKDKNKWMLWVPVVGWLGYPIVNGIQGNDRTIRESEANMQGALEGMVSDLNEAIRFAVVERIPLEFKLKICDAIIEALHEEESTLREKISELQKSKVAWSTVSANTKVADGNTTSLKNQIKQHLRNSDGAKAPHRAFQAKGQTVNDNWSDVRTRIQENLSYLMTAESSTMLSRYVAWLDDIHDG